MQVGLDDHAGLFQAKRFYAAQLFLLLLKPHEVQHTGNSLIKKEETL